MSDPYNCEQYRKARMVALVRDKFRCQAHKLGLEYCEERRLANLTAHHKVPISAGGEHRTRNLITLCRDHHRLLHEPQPAEVEVSV